MLLNPACRTATKFKLGHGEVDSQSLIVVDSQVGHYNMTSFGLSWSWVAAHENEGCLAHGCRARKETRTNLKCWRVNRFGHSVCHLRRGKNTVCQGGLTSMSDFLQLDEKTLYNAKAVGCGFGRAKSVPTFLQNITLQVEQLASRGIRLSALLEFWAEL